MTEQQGKYIEDRDVMESCDVCNKRYHWSTLADICPNCLAAYKKVAEAAREYHNVTKEGIGLTWTPEQVKAEWHLSDALDALCEVTK
jgi:hypothetical protein